MAKRSTSTPEHIELTVEQMQIAIPRLKKRIAALKKFQPEAIQSSEEAAAITGPLKASIDDALKRTFRNGSDDYRRYSLASDLSWPLYVGRRATRQQIVESLSRHKLRAIALLQSAVESLEERIKEKAEKSSDDDLPGRTEVRVSNKIFIVHGHNNEIREAVARFIQQAGFEPVILHEQANKGQTIIEKFEANADVGFAVVLLTPDDQIVEGGKPGAMRSRQNVILELGYFIGRLGRHRVCALKSGEVDLPSDILGVVYTIFDPQGAWKTALAKEMEAAGHEIDWNKIMRS